MHEMRQNNHGLFGKGNELLKKITGNALITFPEIGVAYYPVPDFTAYDDDYFEKYVGYSVTEIGHQITDFRITFVTKYASNFEGLIDIGIGCGQFLRTIAPHALSMRGFDIMPAAIRWLKKTSSYGDPYCQQFDVMTFWDSLEHIPDFDLMLANCRRWAFITMPIYLNLHDDLLRSKHYRKDEHFWYFTHIGLMNVMQQLGFQLIAISNKEREFGRDGVTTFAFERI